MTGAADLPKDRREIPKNETDGTRSEVRDPRKGARDMLLQRICYCRLGEAESNAGFQVAAMSEGITQTMAGKFGAAVSRIEEIPGSCAEGVFFGEDKVYFTHVVPSVDEFGRFVPMSSAVIADSRQWRTLLREQPGWMASLDRHAFFQACPSGAYPGKPVRIEGFTVPETGEGRHGAAMLLEELRLGKEDLRLLLRALYNCLLASTEETLFISLPKEQNTPETAQKLMRCIYSHMPVCLASQLSFCSGMPISARIVFGLSEERRIYPNYVDLFPAAGTETSRVQYLRVPDLPFLEDLLEGSIGEKGPEILDGMDRFLEDLQPYGSDGVSLRREVHDKAKYLLTAAWLYASGIAERGERKPYFSPGADTSVYTMLTLLEMLGPDAREYHEKTLAALVDLYTEKPRHESQENFGNQTPKALKVYVEKAFERTLKNSDWDSPFEQAYLRYLCGAPESPDRRTKRRESMQRFLKNGNSPRDRHLLARLMDCGEAVRGIPATDWAELRRRFRPNGGEEALQKASREMDEALHKAFDELPADERRRIVSTLSEKHEREIEKEILKHQSRVFAGFSEGETAAALKGILKDLGGDREALEDICLREDSLLPQLGEAERGEIYQRLLENPACGADIAEKIFGQAAFAGLPEQTITAAYRASLKNLGGQASGIEMIMDQERVQALEPENFASLLREVPAAGGCTPAIMQRLLTTPAADAVTKDDYYRCCRDILSNPKLAGDGGFVREILSMPRTTELESRERAELLACCFRAGCRDFGILELPAGQNLDSADLVQLAGTLIHTLEPASFRQILEMPRLMEDISPESAWKLIDIGMERAPGLRDIIARMGIFEKLSPERKLRILADYPEEALAGVILADCGVQEKILNDRKKLTDPVQEVCDSCYLRGFGDGGTAAFYENYLRSIRFNPSYPDQSRREIEALYKKGSTLPQGFFDDLLAETPFPSEWALLTDWYISTYKLPHARLSETEKADYEKKLRDMGLRESAEKLQKELEGNTVQRLRESADPERMLEELERQTKSIAKIDDLRNAYWSGRTGEDLNLEMAAFYRDHAPSKRTLEDTQQAFSLTAGAYESLKVGKMPSKDEARSLAAYLLEGKLLDASGHQAETVKDRTRLAKQLQMVMKVLLPLRSQRPKELARDPNLTLLALFGNKPELEKHDVKELVKWAKSSGVELTDLWGDQARALKNEKINKYYHKSLRSGSRVLVIAGVSLVTVGILAAVGIFVIRPKFWPTDYERAAGLYDPLLDGQQIHVVLDKKEITVRNERGEFHGPYTLMDAGDAWIIQLASPEDEAAVERLLGQTITSWTIHKDRRALELIVPSPEPAPEPVQPEAAVEKPRPKIYFYREAVLSVQGEESADFAAKPVTWILHFKAPEALQLSETEEQQPAEEEAAPTYAGETADPEWSDEQTVFAGIEEAAGFENAAEEPAFAAVEQPERDDTGNQLFLLSDADPAAVPLKWYFQPGTDDILITEIDQQLPEGAALPACFAPTEDGLLRCTWRLRTDTKPCTAEPVLVPEETPTAREGENPAEGEMDSIIPEGEETAFSQG